VSPVRTVADGPLRIAMIGPFGLSPKGTMRVRALPLARELAARGHQVTLIMPPWHTPDEPPRVWTEQNVTLHYVALGPRLPLASHAAITQRLVRATLAWQPDVIHCFKPKAYAGLAAWWLWQRRRLGARAPRLVVDEDDWEGAGGWNALEPYAPTLKRFFAWQERWGLRHNDVVTVASRALETLVWAQGVAPARVCYLPNGVMLRPPADGQRVRQALGLGADPVVLLYTRFFEFDVAQPVAVMQRVLAEVPTARLLVVGQALFAADDARFDALVAQAGLSQQVVRAGWVAQDDLPSYFAAADVAIYPFADTLLNRCKCPVKLVDLIGAGLPVVGADVGQIRESVRPGETGLLVPAADQGAMAAGVVRLLGDEGLRRHLAEGAARLAREELAWPLLAGGLASLYARLVRR
jgi:glycosyltransferase involved in cell wall biosynthesis